MNSPKKIISAKWIIPVVPQQQVLEDHCLVTDDNNILAILPIAEATTKYPEASYSDYPNHAIIPGLINAHTHAAMSLFRGLADDLPLMDWLSNHIWPAEARLVDPDFVRDGCELAIAEMLLSGTTCFNDMYFHSDVVARTAQDLGIRAFVGMIVLDFPSTWASGPDEYIEKGLAVHDAVRSLSRVHTTMAPHAPYTVSDGPLEQVRTYADELHVPVHMHLHETAGEVSDAVEKSGMRPLQRLHELGMLNPRLLAVHMTQLEDDDIQLVAQSGVHIVHCPESNLKLASGYCRANDLLGAGVNVCLGTDSAASNNDLDMLGEMRTASLIAKTVANDASALPAWQVLEMATINGARALNVETEIGSLEVGKSADMVAIDLNHIATQPVYDPVAQIVYSASREQVTDVWVQGKHRVKNKKLIDVDLAQLLNKVTAWGQRIGNHPS